jgi:hypothetical protein
MHLHGLSGRDQHDDLRRAAVGGRRCGVTITCDEGCHGQQRSADPDPVWNHPVPSFADHRWDNSSAALFLARVHA